MSDLTWLQLVRATIDRLEPDEVCRLVLFERIKGTDEYGEALIKFRCHCPLSDVQRLLELAIRPVRP